MSSMALIRCKDWLGRSGVAFAIKAIGMNKSIRTGCATISGLSAGNVERCNQRIVFAKTKSIHQMERPNND
jgi:hypothetical protein